MYENYIDLVSTPHLLIPIDMLDLWKTYTINIRTGCVYEIKTGNKILPYHAEDNELYVDLNSEEHGTVTAQLSSLLCVMLYGDTGSGAAEPCTEFPCNSSYITPKLKQFEELNEQQLTINGMTYRRWKNTHYYANIYGAVFSTRMHDWLRRQYNEKGYCLVGSKDRETGDKREIRVHRIVWEAFKGIIPDDLEIDHIDARRYHNYLDNLQLLTHLENLQKKDPKRHPVLSRTDIRAIGEMFHRNVPTREIARYYNLSEQYVQKIKNGTLYADVMASFGIDMSNGVYRDRAMKPDTIREIRKAAEEGATTTQLSTKYNVSSSTIRNIVNQKYYQDVA